MQRHAFSSHLFNRNSASLTALLLASTALVGFTSAHAQELPTGGSVASGGVTISKPSASQLAIKQSTNSAIVNWQSFSIGTGATVNIDQPTSSSVMLNRVTGTTRSTIAGQLNANGQVFLVNPNGIAISKTGKVSAAGFVGSSLDISDDDFKAGKLKFKGKGASAVVSNEGTISIGSGGYAALIGGSVDNAGTISVPLGKVGLGSGEQAALDLSGDGFLQVAVPTNAAGSNALVSNSGVISADGRVEIKAAAAKEAARQAVNMSGLVEARTVSGQSGEIVLGGDQGAVEISGTLDASAKAGGQGGKVTVTGRKLTLKSATVDASGKSGGGTIKIGGDKQGSGTLQHAETTEIDADSKISADATGTGNGGTIIVWSDTLTNFSGKISARGGDNGGDGGFAEVSSHGVLDFDGEANLSARFGDTGNLLLDPYNVTIQASGSPTVPGSGPIFTPTANSTLRVTTLQNALANANVTVTTGSAGSQTGDITVASAVSWTSANSLTLSAYRNVVVNAGLTSTGGAINLRADSTGTGTGTVSFGSGITATTSGVVSIYYNPTVNPAGSGVNTTSYVNPIENYSGNIAGGGTLNAAMLVNTLSDLRNIKNNSGANYALGRGIDATGTLLTSAAVDTLNGSFDGLGNTISNLTITSADGSVGLFGDIASGATVRNLNLANVAITGTPGSANSGTIGGLAGTNEGTVKGVTVSGTVKTTADYYRSVGGLVGFSSGTISGAISTASVQATNYDNAGGLVGSLFVGTITGSSASGAVTVGGQSSGGGLVGDVGGGATINASFATGAVTAANPSKAGGLVGNLDSAAITASYASGVVTAAGASQAGGLVGSTTGTATINTSYATGAVNASQGYVGGLVGATLSPLSVIANSYATGTLTGPHGGGIVGYNTGIITSSYFDLDTTGVSVAAGSGPNTATGGTGLHTSGFMTASNFTGWNFGTTAGGAGWVIVDVDSSLNNFGGAAGGTRPMLLSEYSTTITNAHQLQLMALNLSAKYTLGNNIDASTTAGGQGVWGASGFVPIGSAIATSSAIPSNANLPMGTSNERAFTGTFDGKGFSVSNLYINRPTTDFVGLIGFATGATIQNVTLNGGSVTGRDHVGALLGGDRGFDTSYNPVPIYLTNLSASTTVSGRDFVGGLAGSIEGGYVETVSASGAVSGRDYVGGLGGYMSSNGGYVQNGSTSVAASATGAVNGRNNVGGLFGYFYSSFYGTSFATGTVTGTGNNVGGLMGQAIGQVGGNTTDMIYATGAVTGNSYVGGLIGLSMFSATHSYATGAVTGNTIVGGLVGSNDSGALIDTSFATGIVRGIDQVGGLAGLNLSVIGPINGTGGAYATGAVYGTSNVGGLVGLNGSVNMGSYTLNGRIQNAYSIGAVYGTTNVGGLVGYNANDTSGSNLPATVKASYWDTETAGASLPGIGGGITTGANATATGKTTAQLMAALQTGFSTSAWGIVAGTSLPYFKWLYSSTPQVVTGTAYSDRGTTPLGGVATGILVNGSIAPASAVGSTGVNGYYYFLLPNGTISSGGSQVVVTSSGPSAGATFQQNATGNINGLSTYGGYLKQQGSAATLSALNGARATAVGSNAAASTLIGGLANMEIDPSGATFAIDQAVNVPGTLVISSTGAVSQTALIGAGSLLLLGSGGNYAFNNAGNAIGTLAASTGTVSVVDNGDLTIGSVAGINGVTASGAVTVKTPGKLTIASTAKVTAGSNANVVLSAGGAFVNNRGSDAVSVSGTGRWLVYSSAPGADTFGGLDSGNTAIWNTAAGGAVGPTGNRYVFAYQPTLTFTSTNASMVYGDAIPTLAYSVSGYQPGVANAYLGDSATTAFTGAPTLSTPATLALQPLGAGRYTITIDAGNVGGLNGYAVAFNSTGQISVAKRMVTVTANSGQGKTYGDTDPSSYGYTYSDLGNGVALVGSLSRDAGENVGSYAITQGSLTNANNANYDIAYAGSNFSIGKRAITVTADARNRVYGDDNPGLTYQITTGNLVGGDTLAGALTTSATTASGIGTYGITQGTLDNGNYAISYVGADLTIGKRAITVTADARNRAYGDSNPELTYQVTTGNLVGSDTLTGSLATSATTASSVGTYGITQGSLDNGNYAISYVGADLTVGKRAITVTADAKNRIYGDSNPQLTYQVTSGNLIGSDVLSGSLATSATAASSVGSYGITQGSLDNGNYAISYVGADLTVGKRAITVTADARNRVYGDSNPQLTYQVTSGNLVGSDALTGSLATSATAASSVGSYGITQGSLDNGNYAISYVGADLTIGKRAITVTADARNRAYGDSNPALTYQVTTGNLVGSDTLTGSLATSATTASSVGTYGITQGSLDNGNYAISYVGADLTVGKRAITVTADAKTRAYGDGNPALTYQVTAGNLVNDDSLAGMLATTATTASGVGTYGITQGSLDNGNYQISYVGADLTVGKRAITVTADARNRVYGDGNPALTYQVTSGNLVNDDSLTGALATTAMAGSNVGSYGITQGSLDNSNYAISYVGASLTVGKRSVTVTADAGQGKTYGNADPSSYGYTNSDLGAGVALVGALDRATGENAGNYAVGRGTLTDGANANYAITFVSADFDIGKRAITVTADAQSRRVGMANPAFTYTIGGLGLVGGDTLTGSLSTQANAASAPGSYAIEQGSLGASANYALTYVGANLLVQPANVVPTIDAASTLAFNATMHDGGQPAPVFFTGWPSASDKQTMVEDPRFDSAAFCQRLAKSASVCAAAAVQ